MGKLTLDEENHWVDWVTDAEVAEKSRLEWGMLEYNDIEGFLPFEYVYVDNQIRFRYFYAAMHPITKWFQEKEGDFGDCRMLLMGVLESIVRGQEYLLDEGGYLLKPEWIFWNRQEKRVALCYLPGEKNKTSEDFIHLVEFLMKHMEHKNKAAVEMVYGLYDALQADGLEAEKNLLMIREFQAEKPFQSFEKEQRNKGNRGKYFLTWAEDALTGKIFWKFPETIKTLAIAGETTVGRSETCTHVLPFLQISRKQAVLSEEDGRLYLADTASCNGMSAR